METKRILAEGRIPAFEVNGIPFIRVGQVTYVTLRPIKEAARTKQQALEEIKKFEARFGYPALLTTENEWDELIECCQKNFCLQDFIKVNKLDLNSVANATDTNKDGIVFRAGPFNSIDSKRTTWWSGDDADGEPQSPKSVFATVRLV